jgi:hypothetical protein
MSGYIKLAEAPTLSIRMPDCGACLIEIESDGDGYQCPCCGTSWNYDAGEDTKGELYEDWSGEPAEGPVVDNDEAYRHGGAYETAQLEATLARIERQKVAS